MTATTADLRPGIYTWDGSAWTPAPNWTHPGEPTRLGYARVSTDDQNLHAQADRLAGEVDVLFADKASGAKAKRPYWDRLLAEVAAEDALIVIKLDRMGRSVKNLGEVAALLDDRRADLVVIDQKIDTRSSIGRFVFWMLAAIAQFERDLIIERTRDGQDTVRRAGNLRRSNGGAAPLLGYRDGPGDDWETDPEAAAVLRDVAARLLRGETLDAAFAEQPELTDALGRPVSARNVRAALMRPATAGLITGRDGEIFGPSGIDGPPLDLATFYAVADLFEGRKTGRQTSERFPLGKILACGKCGNQLTGGTSYWPRGSKTPIYGCRTPHVIRPGVKQEPCKGVSIVADDLHAVVRAAVEGWAATSPAYAAASGRQAELTGRSAGLETELAAVRDRIADWSDKLDAGDVTADRYSEAMTRLRARRAGLSAELAALSAEAAHPLPASIDWEEMTGDEQRRLTAEALVTPIRVLPGNGGARPLGADLRVLVERRGAEAA
jgi:DNA invertase Pin-like site-specific DNA recombinase